MRLQTFEMKLTANASTVRIAYRLSITGKVPDEGQFVDAEQHHYLFTIMNIDLHKRSKCEQNFTQIRSLLRPFSFVPLLGGVQNWNWNRNAVSRQQRERDRDAWPTLPGVSSWSTCVPPSPFPLVALNFAFGVDAESPQFESCAISFLVIYVNFSLGFNIKIETPKQLPESRASWPICMHI